MERRGKDRLGFRIVGPFLKIVGTRSYPSRKKEVALEGKMVVEYGKDSW